MHSPRALPCLPSGDASGGLAACAGGGASRAGVNTFADDEPGKARRLRSGSAAAHFADEEPGKAR